jgi:hypothetical protein
MIGLALLSIAVVALTMLAMVLGQWSTGRCLRGSCGALGAERPGDQASCAECPMRWDGPVARPSADHDHIDDRP